MTPKGFVKGHSLHGRPEEDRWTAEGSTNSVDFHGNDGPNPVERAAPNRVDMPAIAGEQPRAEEREFKARNFDILKCDIEEYGHTPLCPGCMAQLVGTAARAHNEECRLRMLMESAEGRARVNKAKERVEKDYGRRRRSKKAKEQPALEGRPPPDAPKVAADEAAGAPFERPAEVEAGQPDEAQGRRKRYRPTQEEARGKKREAEDIEDLDLNEGPAPGSTDDPEVVVQHQIGGSSGPGVQRPEPVPDVAMPEGGQAEPEESNEEAMIGLVERIF